MSVVERWAKTDEQIALMQQAKRRAAVCGWCGRSFNLHEQIYLDRFLVGIRRDRQGVAVSRSAAYAPVGAECASPETLAQSERQEHESCARCYRRVYDRSPRAERSQALCSRRCGSTLSYLGGGARGEAGVPTPRGLRA